MCNTLVCKHKDRVDISMSNIFLSLLALLQSDTSDLWKEQERQQAFTVQLAKQRGAFASRDRRKYPVAEVEDAESPARPRLLPSALPSPAIFYLAGTSLTWSS